MTTARTTSSSAKYRFDLDGLRGIAIALVVVFHVYVGRVSGGVDVFLLLSGYFFIGALYRNALKPQQSLNPWWHIWRTLRRLLPGLLTVVSVIVVGAYFFVPTMQDRNNVNQLLASLLYVQNYELANQGADYAAAGSDTSPLQHLWSMSVQGQFYLGAILLMCAIAWVTRRRADSPEHALSTALLWLVGSVTLASFVWATYLHTNNQSFAYYSTFARLWELGLGALLLLTQHRISMPHQIARVLAPVGFGMVVSTGFLFDGGSLFPGPWALWPLIGAALIIISGGQQGVFTTIMSSKPALFFGQIAYSLYLWHWPLLIFATIYFNQAEPTFAVGTSVIAVSVALAWLTNRFVEKPLIQQRRRPSIGEPVISNAIAQLRTSKTARSRGIAGIAFIAIAGVLVSLQPLYGVHSHREIAQTLDIKDYPGLLSITENVPVPAGVPTGPRARYIRDLWPEPALDGCITLGSEDADKVVTTKRSTDDSPCLYGDVNGDKTMVLIGGSHSEHWFAPLDAVAKQESYKLVVILRQGCPPMLSPVEGVGDICIDWTRAALDYIYDLQPDVVVGTSTRPGSEITDYTPIGYQELYQELLDHGIRVIGLRDTPWAHDIHGEKFSPTKCLINPWSTPTMPESDKPGLSTPCDIPRTVVMSPDNEANYIFPDNPGALSLDFTDVFCDEQRCPAIIGNIYVYRDDNHITNEIAATLSKEMHRRMAPFLRETHTQTET